MLSVSDRRFTASLRSTTVVSPLMPVAADPLEEPAEVRPVGAVAGEVEPGQSGDEHDGGDPDDARRCASGPSTARGPIATSSEGREAGQRAADVGAPHRRHVDEQHAAEDRDHQLAPAPARHTVDGDARRASMPASTKKANVTLLMPVKRPATIGESPNTVASCSREPSSHHAQRRRPRRAAP